LGPSLPPATRTFPLGNNVAVCWYLASVMLLVALKNPGPVVVPAAPVATRMPVVPPVLLVMPAEMVAPPGVPVVPPLPHPAAPAVTANIGSMANLTKTEPARFDMGPPVASEIGVMDALAPTRESVPGNSRRERDLLGVSAPMSGTRADYY
jgi:hypothetical protein